jgi:hypothetical protein
VAHENKVKWLVKILLSRGQQHLLKRWLRYVKNLSDIEEEVVYVCEPEIGRHLSDGEEVR